jgi:hypothetical protein
MNHGNDLFLEGNRGGLNARAAKTSSQLIEEDKIVRSEMETLTTVSVTVPAFSLAKKVAVSAMIHRRRSLSGAVALFVIVAIGAGVALTRVQTLPPEVAPIGAPVTAVKDPAPLLPIPDVAKAPGAPELADAMADGATETIELPSSPQGASEALKDIEAQSEKAATDKTMESKEIAALPVTATNVKIVEDKFEGPIADKNDIPASSVIDAFGFGAKPVNDPLDDQAVLETGQSAPAELRPSEQIVPASSGEQAAEETPEVALAPAMVVPSVKPAQPVPVVAEPPVATAVRYRVVDRKGEKAGFWRKRGNDDSTKEWFVIVEAVDADGKTFEVPVKSADTQQIKPVAKFALQVSERDFMRMSDELLKDKALKDPVIGNAATKTTQPTWSVATTGTMLTEW